MLYIIFFLLNRNYFLSKYFDNFVVINKLLINLICHLLIISLFKQDFFLI